MKCLGCGEHTDSDDCETCFARLARCLDQFGHWPMETSISPAALEEIRYAIDWWVDSGPSSQIHGKLEDELRNISILIRSHLQHVASGLKAYQHEPTDEELLS